MSKNIKQVSQPSLKSKDQVYTVVSSALTKFKAAMELHRSGNLGKAHDIYKELLVDQPNNSDALHLLGVIAYQTGNFQDAVKLIDQAIEINPKVAKYYGNRGRVLQELNATKAAVFNYDKAISIKADYAEVFYNRGSALVQLNQFQAAVASFDKAIYFRFNLAQSYCNRGVALHKLNQHLAAVASFDKAIALQPQLAAAYSNRGITFQELKKFEEAIASYDKAIALMPNNIKLHLNSGNLLNYLNRKTEANAAYTQCLTLSPKSNEEINGISLAFLRLGRYQEAFDFCRKTLSSPEFLMHDGFDSSENVIKYLKKISQIEFVSSRQWTAKRTVMFAGDEVYIEKYFNTALKSTQDTSHGINVHLHAMLSSKTDPRTFHHLINKNVSLSYEVYSPENKTGFTTRRFIRMHQLLKYLNQPILCLDIDSSVTGDLNSFFVNFSKADIGIYRRDLSIVINQLIHAGMFYATPTQASLRFLGFIINYISCLEETHDLRWFADQMALLAADQWSSRTSSKIIVQEIPEKYLSWDTPTKNTLVLTYKGIQKNVSNS